MLYILKTIEIKNKTEEDILLEYQIVQLKHEIWKDKTLEDYKDFIKGWNIGKYKVSMEDNCYFDNIETAKKKAINNACDMNDGGIYNYIAIIKVSMNLCYAQVTNVEELKLFKFDKDEYCYYEVNTDSDEETIYLSNYLGYR